MEVAARLTPASPDCAPGRAESISDRALEHLHEIRVPASADAARRRPPRVSERAPDFVQKINAVSLAGKGDLLPEEVAPVDDLPRVREEHWIVADAVELGRHHALDVLEGLLDRSNQLRDAAEGVDLL